MNKKILLFSILAVFMLVAISYATAINTADSKKKESPLWKIRTRGAITSNIEDIIENIKTKFLGERMFFLPFHWLGNGNEISARDQFMEKRTSNDDDYTCVYKCTSDEGPTCEDTCGVPFCGKGRTVEYYTCAGPVCALKCQAEWILITS